MINLVTCNMLSLYVIYLNIFHFIRRLKPQFSLYLKGLYILAIVSDDEFHHLNLNISINCLFYLLKTDTMSTACIIDEEARAECQGINN